MRRILGQCVTPGRAMGRARTIRTPADLAALRQSETDWPFWASRPHAADDEDLVFVVPGACELAGEPTVPGCVAVLTEANGCRLSSGFGSPVPSVESLGRAVGTIRDGDLVLVDATRGEVLVDPTDRAVSAFQAKLTGLHPIRRFFVDFAHEIVRTPDGRPIVVVGLVSAHSRRYQTNVRLTPAGEPPLLRAVSIEAGSVSTGLSDLDEAIAYGPDLMAFDVGCDCDMILDAVSSSHGKPLLFAVHREGCCEKTLVQSAAWSDITAAIPVRGASSDGSDFQAALEQATEELIEDGTETGRVRIAGWVQEGDGDPSLLAECHIERLIVDLRSRLSMETDTSGTLITPWLLDAVAAARSVAVPVYCVVSDQAMRLAPAIVEAGLGGVVTPVAEVQLWKSALRNALWSVETAD